MQQIKKDVLASPAWSVLIDETQDISHIEQLAIFVKYLDTSNKAKTSFFGLVEVKRQIAAYYSCWIYLELS